MRTKTSRRPLERLPTIQTERRSPPFPTFTLREAIERLDELQHRFDHVHSTRVRFEGRLQGGPMEPGRRLDRERDRDVRNLGSDYWIG